MKRAFITGVTGRDGNSVEAKAKLGWEATITLDEMIRGMVDADVAPLRRQD